MGDYVYLEGLVSYPDWFKGEPVLVHYSDISDKDALKMGYMGWMIGYHLLNCVYPYRILVNASGEEETVEELKELTPSGFRFAVPVERGKNGFSI